MSASNPPAEPDDAEGGDAEPGRAAVARIAAIVLAGGRARRLGGALKPARPVGGRALLLRVLDATAGAEPTIVVGPPSLAPLLPAGVVLIQEEPPGGGPVAGLAAGVRLVPPGVRDVAVLSADLPFLAPVVLSGLSARRSAGTDAAVLLDGSGRPQWLCAVWSRAALVRRLAEFPDPVGVRMFDLTRDVAVVTVAVPEWSGPPPWFDCDTEEDFRRAEELLR